MHRRPLIVVSLVSAALVSVSALEVLASGPGILGFRSQSRRPAAVRTYRSYSVSPGIPADGSAAEAGAGDPAVGSQPAPARPRRSVPSYMRADSKARGRFGQ